MANLDTTAPDPSFRERLIARIVNNIQINITNVHIRYEDTRTADEPFAIGITLNNVELYTTNDHWEKHYLAEQTNRVFKLAKLDHFAVYMNCNTKPFGTIPSNDILAIYRDNIASADNILPQVHYGKTDNYPICLYTTMNNINKAMLLLCQYVISVGSIVDGG